MPSPSLSPEPTRLPAIDWMRGLVMALMALDHASDVFNRNLVQPDSFAFGANGADLAPFGSPLHFLTRWITHLCAPTFVFLAGTALALSVERRAAAGESAWHIDRHLIVRGLLLIVLEVWMTIGFEVAVLQVLYAIGLSIICMTVLRRLPSSVLIAGALLWIVGGEAVVEWLGLKPSGSSPPFAASLLFVNGFWPFAGPIELGPITLQPFGLVMYPLLPWLAMMVLGWTFGRWLLAARREPGCERRAARLLAVWGAAGLVAFVAQRLGPGYGNFWLERTDSSLLRWLQVSKYPASLAYTALELGLMAWILAGLLLLQAGRSGSVRDGAPLLVFGQTALFFYLIHMHLMNLFSHLVFGGGFTTQRFGLAGAWIGAAGILVVMYPSCRLYRRYKRVHPGGWTRYV